VTLYVLDCPGCGSLNEVPQPAKVASRKIESRIHSALRERPLERPTRNSGIGETSARRSPVGEVINRLLLVALMVNFVLSDALADSVEGAKVQPQPLGSPEQANDNEALNPFSGATETVKDPGVP
jgi:hypothetical protein